MDKATRRNRRQLVIHYTVFDRLASMEESLTDTGARDGARELWIRGVIDF